MTKATTTAIGPQTRVNGRIVGDSTVDVYGYVRGEIDLRDTLTVHEEGVVDGDVAADNIIVNGTVRGQLHVRNHLVLGASARVVATIKTHLFTVEEGATFSGDIETHIGGDESAKPLNYAGGNRRNNRQTNRFSSSTSTNSFVSRTINRPSEAKPQSEAVETSEPQEDEQSESYSYIEEHVHQAAAQFNADGTSQSQVSTAVLVLDHPVEEERSEGSESYGYSSESEYSGDSEDSASEVEENNDSYNEAQYVDEDQEISEGYEAEEDHEEDLSEESDSEYEEDDVEEYESSESDDEEDEDLKKKS